MPGSVLDQLLSAFGGPWIDRARQQTADDIAAYQQGGLKALMTNTQGTQELAGGFGGSTTKAVGSGMAQPMFKTTATEEAQKYIKRYGDDLFSALKGIDSHPFWDRPDGINRIADIKSALIDAASPKAINDALKIEQDFMRQNGQTYSQYQGSVFGNRPTHPYGLTDWAQYFQGEPKQLP